MDEVIRGRTLVLSFVTVGKILNDLWIAARALMQPEPVAIATDDRDFEVIAARFPLAVVRPRQQSPAPA